jgi:hypothetical protein
MKSIFTQYGVLASSLIRLPLYTEGTENVSWVKGIDSVTGSGTVGGGTLTEGGSYATLAILNEPTGFMTTNIAYVTNSTVDVTNYTTAYVDWEVIDDGSFHFIVDDDKNGDYNNFDARVTYGSGTGRKTSSISISGLSGSHYIRVNAFESTTGPSVESGEIRIHKVWLE